MFELLEELEVFFKTFLTFFTLVDAEAPPPSPPEVVVVVANVTVAVDIVSKKDEVWIEDAKLYQEV